MIPHFLWAKIRAQSNFFLQTCTREMLDMLPPEEDPQPHYTMLFLSGTKVELVGFPYQWYGRKTHKAHKRRHDTATMNKKKATTGEERRAEMGATATRAPRGKPRKHEKSPRPQESRHRQAKQEQRPPGVCTINQARAVLRTTPEKMKRHVGDTAVF
jgi:hypothetical protein